MPLGDFVSDSLNVLYSDVVSSNRFRNWKATDPSAAGIFSEYALGEIFWKKSIGRPRSVPLRDGFTIAASHEMWLLNSVNGAPPTWERKNQPCASSWWDGKDDSDYWRVPFLIGRIPSGRTNDNNPQHFLYTHIVPSLDRSIAWSMPGGVAGIGALGFQDPSPTSAHFIKEEGAVHLSFEVL